MFDYFFRENRTRLILLGYMTVAVPVRGAYWWVRLLFKEGSYRDPNNPHFDVICMSHVPWGHIWQRNQHTMSRLAKNRKVIYFQVSGIAFTHEFAKHWPWSYTEYTARHPDVELRLPLFFLPGETRHPIVRKFNAWLLRTACRWYQAKYQLNNTVLWFYFPGPSYVLDTFSSAAVVYDIQDEYTAFPWAPADIAKREQHLLQHADVVFAGTQALFHTKTPGFQGQSYFFPCAVEFDHFNSAAPDRYREAKPESAILEKGRHNRKHYAVPKALRTVGKPRLLYVGLIDKRIDPDLLIHVAESKPDWEIVMLGPVDENMFDEHYVTTQCENIHFLGKVDYSDLPAYLAHCDIYIMPWVVNDLTRHINPTKTLEYLAAGRPVVSIALPDLRNLFSDCVGLAESYDEFVELCQQGLAGEMDEKVVQGLDRSRSFAWESVVGEMEGHVREAKLSRANVQRKRPRAPLWQLWVHDRWEPDGLAGDSNYVYETRNGSHWSDRIEERVMHGAPVWGKLMVVGVTAVLLPFALLTLGVTWLCRQLFFLNDRLKSRRLPATIDPSARTHYSYAFSESDTPEVSIIIPFYNRSAFVDECLAAIFQQELEDGFRVEVICIDNASTDGTRDRLKQWPVKVVDCAQRVPAAARNAGIAVARGRLLVSTDSDCLAEPNWLKTLIEPFEDADVLITGGVIGTSNPENPVADFTRQQDLLSNRRFFKGSGYFPPFFATANAAYRRESVTAAGGFDASIWYSEDADLAWRVMDRGGKVVYVPRAVIRHGHRETLVGLHRQARDYGRASVNVFAKHRGRLRASHVVNWQNLRDLAITPIVLPFQLIKAKTVAERRMYLYLVLWRCGFTMASLQESIRRGFLFF